MIILQRYLMRGFFYPLVWCLAVFLSMFIVVDAFSHLDEFVNYRIPLRYLLDYYLCMMPYVAGQSLPPACLIAALFGISALNRNNEITAMKASGVSGYRILFPVFFSGFLLSLFLLAMNETIAPVAAINSMSIKETMIEKGQTTHDEHTIQSVALISHGNKMIYAREFIPATATLFQVIILDQDVDLNIKNKTTAERAVYRDNQWTFYNVIYYELDATGNIIRRPMSVESAIIDIGAEPDEFLKQYARPEFMTFRQLSSHLGQAQSAGYKQSARLLVAMHQKIALPFACFFMIWAGAPLTLRSGRRSIAISISLGLVIMAGYYALSAVTSAFGMGGWIGPELSAWLPNAALFVGGAILLNKYA